MISRIATTSAVAPSSRKSAPSKTWPMSAWMPAGPVTWTSTPSGASSRSVSRSFSTLRMLSVADDDVTGTATNAAVPSSATTTGDCCPPPPWPPSVAPGGGPPWPPPWPDSPEPPASDSSATACWVRSPCTCSESSPSSAVQSTMATCPSSSGRSSSSWAASVLSAPMGEVSVLVVSRSPSGRNARTASASRIGTSATTQAVRRPAMNRAAAGVRWGDTGAPRTYC